MDGQGKMCVVGAGAADAVMRLPPLGYREKVWDHAAGVHFVCEAGGLGTDLMGAELDFSCGRYLPASTTGIVYSNGLVHSEVLEAIRQAQTTPPPGQNERTHLD